MVEWNQCLPVWAPAGSELNRSEFSKAIFCEKLRHLELITERLTKIAGIWDYRPLYSLNIWQYPAIELIFWHVSKTTPMFQVNSWRFFSAFITGVEAGSNIKHWIIHTWQFFSTLSGMVEILFWVLLWWISKCHGSWIDSTIGSWIMPMVPHSGNALPSLFSSAFHDFPWRELAKFLKPNMEVLQVQYLKSTWHVPVSLYWPFTNLSFGICAIYWRDPFSHNHGSGVKFSPKWKETNIGDITFFTEPCLWEEGYISIHISCPLFSCLFGKKKFSVWG